MYTHCLFPGIACVDFCLSGPTRCSTHTLLAVLKAISNYVLDNHVTNGNILKSVNGLGENLSSVETTGQDENFFASLVCISAEEATTVLYSTYISNFYRYTITVHLNYSYPCCNVPRHFQRSGSPCNGQTTTNSTASSRES